MAGSRGQDRGQYEDSEWNAAVELVGLSTPVVVDSRTPAAAAAAGSERNAAVELVGLSTPVVVDSPDPAAAAAADSEWDAAIELGSLSNPVVVDSPTPAAAAAADSEWNAAIELVGLSTPVVVDSTAPAAAAAADSERNAAIELGSLSNPVVVDSPTPAASTVAAASSEVSAKSEEVKIKSNGSGKAKAFKKPDTIVPCARCNSMETKFCYFNNCNENQPRHFCRACKRYWTVGGAMRDVPESCGRRWNKQSSSHRNATKPANGDVPDIPHRGSHTTKPPMAYTQFSTDGIRGLENSDTRIMISRLPLLPPMMSVPRIREPDVPFPQVSPSWSCTPGSTGTTLPSLPPSRVVGPSGRDSLTRGKHPREGNSQEDEKGEKTFWVPKVLRAADPEEAVKSSIWDSLGIKPDQRLFWKCKCKCRQSRF